MRAELRMPNYSLNSGTTSIKQYLVICHVCIGLNIPLSRKKKKKISKEQKSLSSFWYILSFLLQNILSPIAFHEFYFKIFKKINWDMN